MALNSSFPVGSKMLFYCFKCLSEMLYGFVCFRDLKIENLLLDEDNNIKLIGMTFFFLKQDYPLNAVLSILSYLFLTLKITMVCF